ncbi:Forkhead transcription factor [Cryptotrichosporon argae]
MVDLRRASGPLTPDDPFTSGPLREKQPACAPTRQSPRKVSSRLYPTPQSLSPAATSRSPARLPPAFELPQGRYGSGHHHAPFSPYRPGEYQRSELAPSERTRIERKLFDDDDDDLAPPRSSDLGSSPLAPAFEAKMVLRNGASIDLISWLRKNFVHQPPPHTPVTPLMSLEYVRRLLQERFPRVPDLDELARAVLAAFPKSVWDYPDGGNPNREPPMMRGLTWHGRDVAEEDDLEATPTKARPHGGARRRADDSGGRRVAVTTAGGATGEQSRSPTQSTLMSPISSSTRRALPDTPARSVLEEFAEIATLSERTPVSKPCSLPTIPASADFEAAQGRKRRASASPERASPALGATGGRLFGRHQHRRRASTPDNKLHDLLVAAEAVEGSPLALFPSSAAHAHAHERSHKRRRTIANASEVYTAHAYADAAAGARVPFRAHGTASPQLGYVPGHGGMPLDGMLAPAPASPPASDHSHAESHASRALASAWSRRAGSSAASAASALSSISGSVPLAAGPSYATTSSGSAPASVPGADVGESPRAPGRKVNELPSATQGKYPGFDCKPPYPYHEMIRHAIEAAPDRKLQLAQIYASIADRFPFFKTLDDKKTAGWQNSIRHNLSLKKMFVRVNKADGAPDDTGGKGGWWTVQPGVPDEGRPGRKAKTKKRGVSADATDDRGPEYAATGPAPDYAGYAYDGYAAPPAAYAPDTRQPPASALGVDVGYSPPLPGSPGLVTDNR